jgi:hypothetical protein
MATEKEIKAALAEIVDARNKAAKPLTFARDATAEQNNRSAGQLRATLTKISGGWPTVREGVTSTAALLGQVAKSIALFQDAKATKITKEQAGMARSVAESACKLMVAKKLKKPPTAVGVKEGIVCG